MSQLFLVISLAIAVLAVIFALQNGLAVTVTFLIWKFESSLALLLLLTFGLGVVASLLLSIPAIMRRTWSISRHKKRIQELEREIPKKPI